MGFNREIYVKQTIGKTIIFVCFYCYFNFFSFINLYYWPVCFYSLTQIKTLLFPMCFTYIFITQIKLSDSLLFIQLVQLGKCFMSSYIPLNCANVLLFQELCQIILKLNLLLVCCSLSIIIQQWLSTLYTALLAFAETV